MLSQLGSESNYESEVSARVAEWLEEVVSEYRYKLSANASKLFKVK